MLCGMGIKPRSAKCTVPASLFHLFPSLLLLDLLAHCSTNPFGHRDPEEELGAGPSTFWKVLSAGFGQALAPTSSSCQSCLV